MDPRRSYINATNDIAITVLKADWRTAQRRDSFNCLFVQAIKSSTGASEVWVGRGVAYLWFSKSALATKYSLSSSAARLVKQFDRLEDTVRNETFWLRAPRVRVRTKSKSHARELRTPEEIKRRYTKRMLDPKAALDRNSTLLLFKGLHQNKK